MATQADGKTLVGGEISFFGLERMYNLIRLNSDGTRDESFNYSYDSKFRVMRIALLPADEIALLLREYNFVNGTMTNATRLVIVDESGAVIHDAALTETKSSLAVQSDGKVLVGGQGLVRFNTDFSIDATFNVTFNGAVTAIATVADKMFVAGLFSEVNSTTKNDIVKLNADGSIDPSFDPGIGTEDYIGALTVQPDGKLLTGQSFINSWGETQFFGMVRINADGSADTGFNPPMISGVNCKPLYTTDGIYAAAYIYDDGIPKDRLFRLDVNTGQLDDTFAPVELDEFGSWTLQLAQSGNDLILNNTQSFGNVYGLSKLNANGEFVTSFLPEVSRYGTITIGDIHNGKLLVAGDFIRIGGVETYGIARLNLNGTVDADFRLQQNKGAVAQVEVLDDDNILVTSYKHFFKLDGSGAVNSDFEWMPFGDLYQVIKFKVLADGRILVADANTLHRLHSDGSEDESFTVGPLGCFVSTLFDFDTQNEKVIYGSEFCSLGDVTVNRLARLHTDGSVDQTFDYGDGPDGTIGLVKVLDNNEVLIGGTFSQFDGHSAGFLKLSTDGSVDSTFLANQAATSPPSLGLMFQPKVVQIGSIIFIRSTKGIYAVTVDGKALGFTIPADVSSVSDIIRGVETEEGRRRADKADLFAIGQFRIDNEPAFILNLEVQLENDPAEPGEDPVTSVAYETRSSDFTIFPQPVRDKLSVTSQISITAPVLIVDLSGRPYPVHRISSNLQRTELDVSPLAPGFYFLKFKSESGKTITLKFVKAQ